jgi:hypothetical protein
MPDVGDEGSRHHQHYCTRRHRSRPWKKKSEAPNHFNRRNDISSQRGVSPVREPGRPMNGRRSFEFGPPDKNKQTRQKDCVDPKCCRSEVLHCLSPQTAAPVPSRLILLCIDSSIDWLRQLKRPQSLLSRPLTSRIRHAFGVSLANAGIFCRFQVRPQGEGA